MPHLVDVNEIATLLSVKPHTIYKWARDGEMPFHRIGSLVRFNPDEVWKWATNSKEKRGGRRKTYRSS